MPPASRPRITRKATTTISDITTTSTAPEPGQLHQGESKALKRAKMLTDELDSAFTTANLPSDADANLPPSSQPVTTSFPISTHPPFQPTLPVASSTQHFSSNSVPETSVALQSNATHCNGSTCPLAYVECQAAFAAAAAAASAPISCAPATMQHAQYILPSPNLPARLQHGELPSLHTCRRHCLLIETHTVRRTHYRL